MKILTCVAILVLCIFSFGCSGLSTNPVSVEESWSNPRIWPASVSLPDDDTAQPTRFTMNPRAGDEWNFSVRYGAVFYTRECWTSGNDVIIKGFWGDVQGEWGWFKGYKVLLAQKPGQIRIMTREELERPAVQMDPYIVSPGLGAKVVSLQTVQRWEGSSSAVFSFSTTKTPWVVNAGYKPTSAISQKFLVTVEKQGGSGQYLLRALPRTNNVLKAYWGTYHSTIEETGRFTVRVESSGCDWWIQVGVEQ